MKPFDLVVRTDVPLDVPVHTGFMEYIGRVSGPPLELFIDDIYCLSGVPSAHLFLNLGGPVRLWDPDASVEPAVLTDGWFMGLWTKRFIFEYPVQVRLVGAHFKPWGMSAFIDIPAAELQDGWESIGTIVMGRHLFDLGNGWEGHPPAGDHVVVVSHRLSYRPSRRAGTPRRRTTSPVTSRPPSTRPNGSPAGGTSW
jgi:hypothetical protein